MTVLIPMQCTGCDMGALYVNCTWHEYLRAFDGHANSCCYIDSVSTQQTT